MNSDLDSRNEYLREQCLNDKSLEIVENHTEEMFKNIFENVVNEADSIRAKGVVNTTRTVTWGIVTGKRLVNFADLNAGSDEDFLKKYYIEVFGRKLDKSGKEFYLTSLKRKKITRAELAYSLLKSGEGQKKNVEIIGFNTLSADDLLEKDGREFIEHAYLQIFYRNPGMNEITAVEKDLKGGKSKEEILSELINTKEAKDNNIKVKGLKSKANSEKLKKVLFKSSKVKNASMALYNIAHINRLAIANENQQAEINRLKRQIEEAKLRNEELKKKNDEVKKQYEELKYRNDEAKKQYEEYSKDADSRINSALEQICDASMRIEDLKELRVTSEYFEKLNFALSANPTLWGPKDRLHISDTAAVFTCFFNTNSGDITIGDYSFAGSGVSILTGSHDVELTGLPRRDSEETQGRDVIIGNGVWLGSNCTILGPCKIGDNAVIAAGAVVTPGTEVEEGTVYGGVPAKKISEIKLSKEGEISDAMLRAIERNDGVLFTKGWSEKKHQFFKDECLMGHFLLDEKGCILLKNGEYVIKYSKNEKEDVSLTIKEGGSEEKHTLTGKEGIIKIPFKQDDDKDAVRSIIFETEKCGNELAVTIVQEKD